MVNDSYFRFEYDNKIKYTFSQSWQAKWVSWRHTAPYIEWKIIARIVSILDTHSAAYTWQAIYKFNAFRWVCIMMIMRWWNLQTNEHDFLSLMYPIVCKYHRLNINKWNVMGRPWRIGVNRLPRCWHVQTGRGIGSITLGWALFFRLMTSGLVQIWTWLVLYIEVFICPNREGHDDICWPAFSRHGLSCIGCYLVWNM